MKEKRAWGRLFWCTTFLNNCSPQNLIEMESIYVSVILLLLGVITGGAMVVGLLQGQQNRLQARRYHPEDLAIAMANTSARRSGMDSWGFLLFLDRKSVV